MGILSRRKVAHQISVLDHVPEKFESQTLFFCDLRYLIEQLCEEISFIGWTSRFDDILAWTM